MKGFLSVTHNALIFVLILSTQQTVLAETEGAITQTTPTTAVSNDTLQPLVDPDLLEALQYLKQRSTHKPTPPVRRSHSRHVSLAPREVPDYLDTASPLTVKMVAQRINSHNGDKITRVISRAKDRIHVFFKNQGQEWLFVRNPRDGRRVLGRLIDHKERVILDFPEADLVDNRVARGWVDVFTIGVSPDRLADLRSTGRRKEQDGIVFGQFVAQACEGRKTKFNEVWWSNEQALPLKFVSSEGHGGWIQDSVAIRIGVDEDVLRDPQERYPAYATMDMVDWREEHHGSHNLDGDH